MDIAKLLHLLGERKEKINMEKAGDYNKKKIILHLHSTSCMINGYF